MSAIATTSVVQAAPVLTVNNNFSSNVWGSPTSCVAGTSMTPTAACAPSVTAVISPASGFRLDVTNNAPTAFGTIQASSLVNGVLTAGVEGQGIRNIVARSRFVESYTYNGPANTPYMVPFHITGFALRTTSLVPGDLQAARMLIRIGVTTNNIFTTVALLDWRAQSNSINAFALTQPPVPVAGVSLAQGFLTFTGIPVPNSSAVIFGPGGAMTVNLGSFASGQAFTLDYRMSCSTFGSGPGSAVCGVGDPFAIASGPGFDLQGLATPNQSVPEPATWAMLVVGFGLAGSTLRGRRAARRTPPDAGA